MGSNRRFDGRLETYFKCSALAKPLPDTVGTATRTTAAVAAAAMLSRSGLQVSPFAAVSQEAKQNPVDIISSLVAGPTGANSLGGADQPATYQESGEQLVIVGASGHISDSDDEIQGMINAFGDDGTDRWSEHQHEYDLGENDPSLYKITPTTDTSSNSNRSNENALGMLEIADDDECTEPTTNASNNTSAEASTAGDSIDISGGSSFSKPVESLSLRSHASITSAVPLKQLERLNDDINREMERDALRDYTKIERIVATRPSTSARRVREHGNAPPNASQPVSQAGDGVEYLVKWKRLPYNSCSWVTADEIGEDEQAELDAFLDRD
ncbi:hypothetical protein GQ54DRAFT_313514, partial [Martensiomyces pterosporus]